MKWRKSSRSGPQGGNCVEVAFLPSGVGVRDSKNPDGPVLVFGELVPFLGAVRKGRYDRSA